MGDGGLLFLQEVDQFDVTVFTKVSLQLVLRERLEVLDVANIDIPRGSRVHSHGKSGRKRARILAPTNFESSVVQSETLIGSDLVESESRGCLDECDELE